MSDEHLIINSLRKRFGKKEVLKDINLKIAVVVKIFVTEAISKIKSLSSLTLLGLYSAYPYDFSKITSFCLVIKIFAPLK